MARKKRTFKGIKKSTLLNEIHKAGYNYFGGRKIKYLTRGYLNYLLTDPEGNRELKEMGSRLKPSKAKKPHRRRTQRRVLGAQAKLMREEDYPETALP